MKKLLNKQELRNLFFAIVIVPIVFMLYWHVTENIESVVFFIITLLGYALHNNDKTEKKVTTIQQEITELKVQLANYQQANNSE